MKLKSTILAAALVICNGGAFADNLTETVTLTNVGGFWTGGFTLSHQAGAFNDSITFNPAAMGSTYAAIFNLGFTQAANIDFTSATLYALGSSDGIPLVLGSSFGGAFESGISSPTLLTGPFRLDVSGMAGQAATYTGSLNVSPVPETETYAMFGAGLGVVGFFARRRARNGVVRNGGAMPATAA